MEREEGKDERVWFRRMRVGWEGLVVGREEEEVGWVGVEEEEEVVER